VKTRVMIVEDDQSIGRMVQDGLEREGFQVALVTDGGLAVDAIRRFEPDLVLLDLMLPGLDGFEVCRAVDRAMLPAPIIVLSARTEVEDKVLALRLGADDYMTKPFMFEELLARVHALLRRAGTTPGGPLSVDLGDVHIDFATLRATKGGRDLDLTHRELEILRYLHSHHGKVVSRDQLLRDVWGYSELPVTRTVDHFIARLRSKIEDDPKRPKYLHTVYGDGYKLTPNPATKSHNK
jgi:two-component system alkaline phosphatase synthesis response regulator PhoP